SLTCLTLLLLHMRKPSFNYFGDDCFTQLIKPPTFIMSTRRGDNACAAFILIPFPFISTSNVSVVSILDRIFSKTSTYPDSNTSKSDTSTNANGKIPKDTKFCQCSRARTFSVATHNPEYMGASSACSLLKPWPDSIPST